jgi:starch synthase (maltosyl-transferring)
LTVVVDRVKARCAAWYEMFWRSQGSDPTRSATVDECIARLAYVRDLGFDTVYLVPHHPIGEVNRKGRNNSLVAGPDDPGSPYAIGSRHGGHDAVNPDWGTLEDFRRFVAAVEDHGMEVAMDFAIQCSPDHPWIKDHPDWFDWRPDGSIKYAENPPKKYEDIVNVDFYDAAGNPKTDLWLTLRDLVLFWIDQGVKVFRVDNPHTKPLPFWQWMIADVQARHPEAIFLAEAFTRPKLMKALAKVGFTQSYSYFTWRNHKAEIVDYLEELTQGPAADYMRANFFPNTPDILPRILQEGGRPAFLLRIVLAATLSSVYGMYNGFELCENRAVPGKEEYLDSEKYQYKVWDWDRPGHIKDWVRKLNEMRHDNPALHEYTNLEFFQADDPNILVYGKMTADRSNAVLVAVNLDPHAAHETTFELPLWRFGLPDWGTLEMEELFSGHRFTWTGKHQHLWIDNHRPAFVWRMRPVAGETV